MPGKHKCCGLLAILSGALSQSAAFALSVPITNPGFESQVLGDNTLAGLITGWQDGDQALTSAGTYNPPATSFTGPIPEGSNIAYSNGPFISQVLSQPLTAGASYTLQVDVGNRMDVASFPAYTIELRAGGVTLSTTSSPAPSEGAFGTATVNFVAPANHAQLNTPLEIRMLTGGTQVTYDNVRLDASILNPGVNIAINNPGFDNVVLADNANVTSISGWVAGGAQGTYNPPAGSGHPTTGANTAFSNGGTISQVLAETLRADSTYVLTVDLIDRFDLAFPSYQVQLFAGGVLLAQDNNTLAPLSGFLTSKVQFTAPTGHAQLGAPLEIRLISGGIQANFDNVRLLRFDIPEPATAVLLLMSAPLAMRRRRALG